MGKASIFLDGGYIDKVLFHNFPEYRFDYGRLIQKMLNGKDFDFINYYNESILSYLSSLICPGGGFLHPYYTSESFCCIVRKRRALQKISWIIPQKSVVSTEGRIV